MFDPAEPLREYEIKEKCACGTDGCTFDGEVIVKVREYKHETVSDFVCPECGAELEDVAYNEDLRDFDDYDYGYDY